MGSKPQPNEALTTKTIGTITSSANLAASTATHTKCVHFAKLRVCQLQFSGQCCACADTRPKTERSTNVGVGGRNRFGSSSTSAPFYQHYCKGCFKHFTEKEQFRRDAKIAKFRLWQKDPSLDGELSILCVNYYLRRGLNQIPFEVVHVILAFTFVNPPIAWFRSFDRPQLTTKVLKQQTLSYKKVKSATERGQVCSHAFCMLSVAKAQSRSRYSYYHSPIPLGCCGCMDRRPASARTIDVVYVDGKGDVLVEVPFWKHYCPGCKDHYTANPKDYPFVDKDDE